MAISFVTLVTVVILLSLSLSLSSMDTLSSSVSTLKIPSLQPSTTTTTTNREFHHFTRTPHTYTTRPIPSVIPKKTNTFSHNHHKSSLVVPFSSSSNTSPLKPEPVLHRNPATGYAAAIIHVSQNTNSLHSVQRDVNRLLKFLQSYGIDQGQAIRKVVEHGNFHGRVVALVKMLVKKNKVGIVKEVLEEFERIYDELCRTQVVLVSSAAATKMGEDQLFGIAKSVQQLSGAARVKVKNLVQHTFSSFNFGIIVPV